MIAVAGMAGSVQASDWSISEDARNRIEPVLKKSGGQLTYFEGPSGMIGVGVTFTNGRQMVAYATPDGSTLFSGAAVNVETGVNLSVADLKKLPPPDYAGLVEMVAEEGAVTMKSEGNPDSENRYFVFVDPKCPYCHKAYNSFLTLLADGHDLVVHYIPVSVLGPESENTAKEMIALPQKESLALFRSLAKREPHLSDRAKVERGNLGYYKNMALFRQLQLDAVPVIMSDVSGTYNVRRGMVTAEALQQELKVAKVQKMAAAQ